VPSTPTSKEEDAEILVVEDIADLQYLFREQLERAGPYSVRTADDGVEAMEMIEESPPDLIFLDLNLPHLDGQEVARRTRELDPSLPIVIVSGYDVPEEFDDLLVDDYLVKPFSGERLAEAAATHLSERADEATATMD
jgi:CheY-like chemotaxis protein